MAEMQQNSTSPPHYDVVVFSKDEKLVSTIKRALVEYTFGTPKSYGAIQSDEVYQTYRTAVATVLDLDLIEGDIEQARRLINRIKPAGVKHALFIVGNKPSLKRLMSNPSLRKCISRTFEKPMSRQQVTRAVDLVREQARVSNNVGLISRPAIVAGVIMMLMTMAFVFLFLYAS